jgi:putative membrane protein
LTATATPAALATGALALVAALVGSGVFAYDRLTWLLEVLPVLVALPLLAATRRSYPLTPLVYGWLFVHALVLIVGGTYTYARVPAGFAVADWLHLARNPYDKLGHFMQGFVPALVAREILVRGNHVAGGRMRAFLVLCVVLAISAAYELVEWAGAVVLGEDADEFLGTQGDPWDTQSDMLCALVGGIAALASLSRVHDAQLARLAVAQAPARATEV